jgi:hypothetical protein
MRLIGSSSVISLLALGVLFGSSLGCSAGTNDATTGAGNQGGSGGTAPLGGSPMGGSGDGGSTGQFNPQGGGTTQPGCDTTADADTDGDGITLAEGDCNDCDANVGPGAIEVIPADDGSGGGGGGGEYVPVDEDCDGEADNVAPPCDGTLDMIGTDPYDGARAIELCKVATNDVEWGLLNAQWVRANGVPATVNAQMGILPDFGPNVLPRSGARMLGISSGTARDIADPGFVAHSWSANGPGTAPPGYPQDVPGCPVSTVINDDVALELSVRSPKNATGYHFDFKFYSNEYPEFVCTTFNDQFIALVNPAPMGANNGNISFDSGNNPVSVNIAFFDVCQGCPAGTAEMEGTDFIPDDGGTSWLQTSAPVTGGDTFSIRFAIWDVGDSSWDSTTLIDNFAWVANGGTVTVGTTPVPE